MRRLIVVISFWVVCLSPLWSPVVALHAPTSDPVRVALALACTFSGMALFSYCWPRWKRWFESNGIQRERAE